MFRALSECDRGRIAARAALGFHRRMGDLALYEGLATGLYLELGFDPSEPQSPITLARRWLGPDAIVEGPSMLAAPAVTFFQDGRTRFAVRPRLAMPRKRHAIGHELGHALLKRAGEPDSERAADYIGAALMAPYAAARAYDDDWRSLAEDIGSTQTQAALRTAEVLLIPRALVTPGRVYLRGPEGWVWPLARRSLERYPGVRKTVLDDDPKRFVLDVEEVG